jgi:hypothetical protein
MSIAPKFRSPLHQTAVDIAAALSMTPRAKQEVRRVISWSSDGETWIVAGIGDKHYRVRPPMFDLLMRGRTPESLELDEYDEDDEADEAPDYPERDRECSAADRAYQRMKEQF